MATWTPRRLLPIVAVGLVLVLLGVAWWTSGGNSSVGASPSAVPSVARSAEPTGLGWVEVSELPKEAAETLKLIDRGGPFPYDRDGVTFRNDERLLPRKERGYYREYTVRTPGERSRGARRIVTGKEGEFYWTDDHYASFARIRR